jgi:ribosomal protein L11 methyltransferase
VSTSSASAWVEVRVHVDAASAEAVGAEVWGAGASGLEEREEGGRVLLIVYAPASRAREVERAAAAAGALAVEPARPVVERDWAESWKQGLAPVVVSERIVVRPPFAARALAEGQSEVVIEPRQAFGTGTHASTRLALELVDRVLQGGAVARVLDVGCGSGVLALVALRLGAERAVACDLDRAAADEARSNALRNELGGRLAVFAGSTAALGEVRFDLVVANLLRSEMVPLLDDLAARTRPGGALVLSGLLAPEGPGLVAALEARGVALRATREQSDALGDAWLALLMARPPEPARRRAAGPGCPPAGFAGPSR